MNPPADGNQRYAEEARALANHIGDHDAAPGDGATMVSGGSFAPMPR